MQGTRRNRGFTLLELIVVITIMGIMGTFVVMNVAGSTGKARITKARNDVQAIYGAAQAIEAQTGIWPETIEECVNPVDDMGMKIPGTLSKYPMDPWKRDYIYELREDGPVVYSLGKNGTEGGDAEDSDFYYPEQDGMGGY